MGWNIVDGNHDHSVDDPFTLVTRLVYLTDLEQVLNEGWIEQDVHNLMLVVLRMDFSRLGRGRSALMRFEPGSVVIYQRFHDHWYNTSVVCVLHRITTCHARNCVRLPCRS